MCNRYRVSWAWREATQEFSDLQIPLVFPPPERAPNIEPRDLRPTNPAPILRPVDPSDPGAGLEMRELRWDLVPFFHKGPIKAKKYLCTNARTETVATTSAFREPFKRRRCLVPASAYYEWTGPRGGKTMWRFTVADQALFCFAGLWDRAQTADGEVESFTLLTCAAGPDMAPFHDRQPVILRRDQRAAWLDLQSSGQELLTPGPAGTIVFARVEAAQAEP